MSQVELWLFDFAEWMCEENRLAGVLAADEIAQAGLFRFAADRTRCRLSRSLARLVLAHRLHTDPRRLILRRSVHGKPYIPGSTLYFNLSHTTTQMAIAVAGSPVGADIEWDDGQLDANLIAAAFLHPTEEEQFRAQPTCEGRSWLLRLWTEREAFFKAVGSGLLTPMKDYAWQPIDDRTKRVVTYEGVPVGWYTHHLGRIRGHPVTVATSDPNTEVLVHQSISPEQRAALLTLLDAADDRC